MSKWSAFVAENASVQYGDEPEIEPLVLLVTGPYDTVGNNAWFNNLRVNLLNGSPPPSGAITNGQVTFNNGGTNWPVTNSMSDMFPVPGMQTPILPIGTYLIGGNITVFRNTTAWSQTDIEVSNSIGQTLEEVSNSNIGVAGGDHINAANSVTLGPRILTLTSATFLRVQARANVSNIFIQGASSNGVLTWLKIG